MTLSTGTGSPILRPAQVGDLLVQPVTRESVAAQVCTVVFTESHEYRIPIVSADPSASWVAEGDEIAISDATLTEKTVTPAKIAGLSVISRELANDSSPEAADEVGQGLARDIARKLDQAFFAGLPAPAADGLAELSGHSIVQLTATTWADTDWAPTAISMADAVGATIDTFVANPADALALATLKDETGSNRPLLSTDATMPTRRVVAGVPLLTSPYVPAGTVWGIPRPRVVLVVREDAEVTADASVFFTSDRVAVRAVMRAGFGFPHAAALVQVSLAAA